MLWGYWKYCLAKYKYELLAWKDSEKSLLLGPGTAVTEDLFDRI